jgi:predicted dehydrogenase
MGIIGCGSVTEHKSGPAFKEIECSEVVAVMSRHLEKAKEYAKSTTLRNGTMMLRQ